MSLTPVLRLVPSWSNGAAFVVLAVAAMSLVGCEDMTGLSGSISAPVNSTPHDEADLRAYAEELGKRYALDPGEKTASIAYARALRQLARYAEAASVMRAAAIRSPKDFEVLGEYGKALADAGPLDQAAKVLANAYTTDRPDWTIMSVQGAVADELGDHVGARRFYHDALQIAPGEPYVLNNLGLSYMLTRQLPQAEAALREADASPRADARVRNNLALVLALEGKSAKAQAVSRTDMSPGAAAAAARTIALGPPAGASSVDPTEAVAYKGE